MIVKLNNILRIKRYFESALGYSLESVISDSGAESEIIKVKLYELINSGCFLEHYSNIVNEVATLVPFPVLCQRSPTLRVQRPGENSIIFHIDEWAGHDRDSLNAWIPLVDVDKSSSLGVVDKLDTNLLLEQFYRGELSAELLEAKCRAIGVFRPMKVGSALLFGNHTLHGTTLNTSLRTRISIDFRLTPLATTINQHQRYIHPSTINKPSAKFEECQTSAFYCVRSDNALIDCSFSEQRSLIQSYCKRHGIVLVGETHEIQGRAVPELPFLSNAIKKYPQSDLVIMNIGCFYQEEMSRLEAIRDELSIRGNKIITIIH
jgi:hypothetical protein